jgi:hypothetical protein
MTGMMPEPVPDTVGAVMRADAQCDPPENRVASPASVQPVILTFPRVLGSRRDGYASRVNRHHQELR